MHPAVTFIDFWGCKLSWLTKYRVFRTWPLWTTSNYFDYSDAHLYIQIIAKKERKKMDWLKISLWQYEKRNHSYLNCPTVHELIPLANTFTELSLFYQLCKFRSFCVLYIYFYEITIRCNTKQLITLRFTFFTWFTCIFFLLDFQFCHIIIIPFFRKVPSAIEYETKPVWP